MTGSMVEGRQAWYWRSWELYPGPQAERVSQGSNGLLKSQSSPSRTHKATPPNPSNPFKWCHSLVTKHSNMWVHGGHSYLNHHKCHTVGKWQKQGLLKSTWLNTCAIYHSWHSVGSSNTTKTLILHRSAGRTGSEHSDLLQGGLSGHLVKDLVEQTCFQALSHSEATGAVHPTAVMIM